MHSVMNKNWFYNNNGDNDDAGIGGSLSEALWYTESSGVLVCVREYNASASVSVGM
jgi:hypothetical protein